MALFGYVCFLCSLHSTVIAVMWASLHMSLVSYFTQMLVGLRDCVAGVLASCSFPTCFVFHVGPLPFWSCYLLVLVYYYFYFCFNLILFGFPIFLFFCFVCFILITVYSIPDEDLHGRKLGIKRCLKSCSATFAVVFISLKYIYICIYTYIYIYSKLSKEW